MQELPVLQVTQGAPISDEITLKAQVLTGYTGEAKFKRRYALAGLRDYGAACETQGRVFLTAPVTVTPGATDTVMTLEVSDTSAFPVLDKIGYFVTAFVELKLTGPAGQVQSYQRSVAVAGAF